MPIAAPKPCTRHPKVLLKRGEKCPLCPKQPSGWLSDSERGNRHERGYGSKWDNIRKRILQRDKTCKICKKAKAVTVDHIVQKADGGSDDDNNLQGLCWPCHKTKTSRESNKK